MKKSILTLSALLLLATQSPAWANEKDEVNQAFAQWRTSLSSGSAENVVALYEKDAVLLATLAATPLTTQEQRMVYFATLTAKPKLATTVTEEHIRLLGKNDAIVSGLYTFSFEENGKKVEIPARFSFVYEKENGKWMIIEHHSSKVPQSL
jgi:uncharacterized protein (TIGR02246 family)